jgi:DNA invertase Pin-like site-specific DNA recombinase
VRAARRAGWVRVMAKIGYARVSTRSQNDDSQVDDLTAYGCDKIFTDTASGKNAARPELDKALAYLRAGDVLVITRLSRAMRSLKHLLALAEELRERGASLFRKLDVVAVLTARLLPAPLVVRARGPGSGSASSTRPAPGGR